MKIQGVGSFFYNPRTEEAIREKKTHSSDADGGAGQGQNSYSQEESSPEAKTSEQTSEEKSDPTNSESTTLSTEQVLQAISSFQTESSTQSNGLSASLEGTGPGLKVVLKDGTGNVIRHFSGEEFVRLRDSNSKDLPSRGKILDRKL